jgi:hypothetical protein
MASLKRYGDLGLGSPTVCAMRLRGRGGACTILVGLVLGVLGACGGHPSGNAKCQEGCSVDDDCIASLGCFSTTAGRICLPLPCGACYASSMTAVCKFDMKTDGTCVYTACQ